MTKQELKKAIEATAKETGMGVVEVITMAQTGAAKKGDEDTLETLCELKWDYIS